MEASSCALRIKAQEYWFQDDDSTLGMVLLASQTDDFSTSVPWPQPFSAS